MDQSENKQVNGTPVLKTYNRPKLEVYGSLVDLTANNNKSGKIDNPSGMARGTN
jgi:hypothetical protein